MNICFNVLHQRLIRGDSVPLIEGSKDYIHCTFTFSEDWTALGKAALFSLQGDSKTYVAVIDNNSCKIPDAVCQSGGRCEMALIGAGYDVINALSSGSTDELKSADVIITTNRCELRFGETVTVNTVNEDASKENPFADVLAKITALSDNYTGAINETARKQERLQYYGDANIVPTDTANFKFTISDGTASIDGFADGVTITDIVIPYKYVDDNGNEYRVTTISDSAFFHLLTLTSVIIPSTITEIEQYAFESCGLTSIYIPDSVITIGKSAFQSSTIKKVRLSNSLAEISEGVFATCPIEEIVIPDSVTSIGGAAFVFAKDTHITIPHNVTSLGDYVFEGCTSLLEAEILNDNITISDDAFVDCTNVTIICGEGSTAETFCKEHSIPYRYNTVTDDFIIYGELGIVGPVLTLTDVSVGFSDISEAFQSGKNILMQLYYPDLNVTVRMPLVAYNDNIIVFSFVDHEAILYALTWTSENIAICHVIRLASQEYVREHIDEAWQWKTALEERITTLETALASYKTSLNEKVEYAEWEAHEADMMNLVIDNQKSIAALEEEISGVNADLEAALEGDV